MRAHAHADKQAHNTHCTQAYVRTHILMHTRAHTHAHTHPHTHMHATGQICRRGRQGCARRQAGGRGGAGPHFAAGGWWVVASRGSECSPVALIASTEHPLSLPEHVWHALHSQHLFRTHHHHHASPLTTLTIATAITAITTSPPGAEGVPGVRVAANARASAQVEQDPGAMATSPPPLVSPLLTR